MSRPDYWKDCTVACERIVECVVCGKRKAPNGRDPGMYSASSYCAYECPGRYQPPLPGHLWPGELAEMDAPPEDDE